jgi:hypothetical protein
MFCVECGARNPDGAKFCNGCGKALTTPTPSSEFAEPEVVLRQFPINALLTSHEGRITQVSQAAWEEDSSSKFRKILALTFGIAVLIGAYKLIFNNSSGDSTQTSLTTDNPQVSLRFNQSQCSDAIRYIATVMIPSSDIVATDYKCAQPTHDLVASDSHGRPVIVQDNINVIVSCVWMTNFSSGSDRLPCEAHFNDDVTHNIIQCSEVEIWIGPQSSVYPCESLNLWNR